MSSRSSCISNAQRVPANLLRRHHPLHPPLRTGNATIVLGNHDLGVPVCAADLYRQEGFPYVVFSGEASPISLSRSPTARP